MKRILLTGAYNYTNTQKNKITNLGYYITYVQDETSKLNIDVSNFDVVVCNNLFLHNDIKNFKKLEFIQLTSAGLDRVPIDYIVENRIALANASGIYSIPIAEFVILKILEIYKQSRTFFIQQDKKQWVKLRNLEELTDKNVAIVGFGSIGQEIAKRIKPFKVNVISVDIVDNEPSIRNKFIHIDDIQNTISNIDVFILTLPLLASTKHIIDKDLLQKMKINSILINVSRGEIIKTVDLIDVLKSRKDITAVLDVFEEEPLDINSCLWEMPNVFITPHNSYVSNLINSRLFDLIYINLKRRIKRDDTNV